MPTGQERERKTFYSLATGQTSGRSAFGFYDSFVIARVNAREFPDGRLIDSKKWAKKSLNLADCGSLSSFRRQLVPITAVIRFITPQMSWSALSDWNLGRGLTLIYWCRRGQLIHLEVSPSKGFFISRERRLFLFTGSSRICESAFMFRELGELARSHSAVISPWMFA